VTAPDSTHRHERILDLEARLPALRAGGIDAVVVGGPGRESADALTNTSQTLLAAIVNSSDDAIMAQSLEGIILSWNPAAEKMYGYTAEEVVGKSVSMLSPAGMADEMVGILGQIKAGERIEHHETSRRAKDGSIVQVSLTVSPVHDDAGHVVAASSTARDITGQLRADAQAKLGQKRAAEYARSLIEASLDPLVTISPEGKITDVNEATVNVTGAPREALVGTDFSDYFTDPDQARAGYQQVFAQGSVTDYPLTIRHRDGRLTDVVYNAAVTTDASGHVLGVFAAARDVTAQKAAEAEIARRREEELAQLVERAHSQELLDTVFQTLPDLICIAGMDGYFRVLNPAWEHTLGWTTAELLARPLIEFVHPDDRQRTLHASDAQACRGEAITAFENRYRCRDGSYRWLQWNSLPLAERGILVANARDITERKQAVDGLSRSVFELERRSEELARSNRELEQFAYMASHDLQEPLRMVASFTALLAEDLGDSLDDDNRLHLDFARDGAVRMQQLVNDLLEYSRVGRGADLSRRRVDCDQLVETATVDLHEAIAAAGATVTHDRLPPVTGVPTELRQLFTNLVGNAVKFRGDEPVHVHVSAAHDGSMWQFSVADNGIGIDPGQAERIFEVFKRLHPRGRYPGTGIGLAICKKVVEHHGGRIWVESQPGTGATFRYTLPAAGNDQGGR